MKHPGQSNQSTREQHDVGEHPGDVDASDSRGSGTGPDSPELESQAGAVEKPADEEGRGNRQQEPEVQAVPRSKEVREHRRLHHPRRFRVVRAGRLEKAGRAQHPVDEVEGNVVEHDRGDDLMGAGLCLEEAGNAAPERAGDDAGCDRENEVQPVRQRKGEPDPARGSRTEQHLAAATDIEQTGTETERDTKSGHDQRGGEGEGVGEWLDAIEEPWPPEVVDRTLEERDIGAGHRLPDRAKGCTRLREEVRGRLLHPGVGQGDQDAADDQGQQNGQYGHQGAPGKNLPHCHRPARRLRFVGT